MTTRTAVQLVAFSAFLEYLAAGALALVLGVGMGTVLIRAAAAVADRLVVLQQAARVQRSA